MNALTATHETDSPTHTNQAFLRILVAMTVVMLLTVTALVASIWFRQRQQISFIERVPGNVLTDQLHNPTLTSLMGYEWMRGIDPITTIQCSGPEMTDELLSEFGDHQSLEVLSLSNSAITDAGLVHLENLENLRSLTLGSDQVTDAGLRHLTSLTKLRLLDLRGTVITDSGLKQLHKMSSLQTLLVPDDTTTLQGYENLQSALPQCQVYRN